MHPVLFQLGSLVIPSYGAAASIGVLLALAASHRTARRVNLDPRHLWNLIVLAIFSALVVSRLTLILINLGNLRAHPRWLLALAMVHHPLLAAIGIVGASLAAVIYLRWAHLPWRPVADALTAPLALGIACEQVGALMAGSGFGTDATVPWAVTYTSVNAARWSGTPLGLPLHPVQGYAALGALLVAALCWWLLASRPTIADTPARKAGDVAGVWLIAMAVVLFLTENFRDWEGRGVLFRGTRFAGLVDAPQLVAIAMVLVGGLLLADLGRHPAPLTRNPQGEAAHG